jgi:DNA-binding CsgD family transcriptional regulator
MGRVRRLGCACKGTVAHLTESEVRVLVLVARGWSDRQVARGLGMQPSTISSYVRMMMRRAGASSRTELVARCILAGILVGESEGGWPPLWSGNYCLSRRGLPGPDT